MTDPSVPLSDLLRTRRSIRRFLVDRVPEAAVRRMLEAACLAPSAHNRQPWRFVVVQEAGARRDLAEAMGSRLTEDLQADGHTSEVIEQRTRRSRDRLLASPVVIVLCLSMAEMDRYPDARRQDAERTMAVHSLALAGGNLLLAAHAEGLGACWLCAPLFAPEVVRQALDLPSDWEPQGMVIAGYPAEQPGSPPRRSLDEVTAWR
jgi:coenzyme F420-0:L-glutamate ligase/coenzyme F420-1:gamma-L-glutamate ligase